MIREFHDIPLRGRNSFGIEQRAAHLVECDTEEDVARFFAAGMPREWMVLGGGNNILFTRDYGGTLVVQRAAGIRIAADEGDTVYVEADAGVEWDDLVAWAADRGLWGIENLSLIPGKAGAAPVQNIGAYGCEAKESIAAVRTYCPETRNTLVMDAAHCGFGYRESVFKHQLKGRAIITAVTLRLSRTPRPRLGYGDLARETEARGGATLHNIREGVSYPATLVTTADHDDRVVPAHSFKFAAQMQHCQAGDAPVLIRIESKAGHGAGKPTSKRIDEAADVYAFLFQNIGVPYVRR